MFFYTYVLKSVRDGKLYIGSSGDLKTRLKAYNSGQVASTKIQKTIRVNILRSL